MKISSKLLLLAILPVVFFAVIIIVVVLFNKHSIDSVIVKETNHEITDKIKMATDNLYKFCMVQNDEISAKLQSDLNVANFLVSRAGGIVIDSASEKVEWTAVNQFTKKAVNVQLPKMLFGHTWMGMNYNPDKPSIFVDEVEKLTGSTCTVFQRMNKDGDMLRVATNIKKLDGKRAVGTYIPFIMPDGSKNKVLETIYNNKTYYGMAFVVNANYLTAYMPITDAGGNVVGIIYVGVKHDSRGNIRRSFLETVVGNDGYAFVLQASGANQGKYIISDKGEHDGDSVLGLKSGDGRNIVKEILEMANSNPPGYIGYTEYEKQSSIGGPVEDVMVAFTRLPEWNWLIGVNAYRKNFMASQLNIRDSLNYMITITVIASILLVIIVTLIAVFVTKSITVPINDIISQLNIGSTQIDSAAGKVSETSQSVSSCATEQAASLEEVASSIEEMSSVSKSAADNAVTGNTNMRQAMLQVEEGAKAVSSITIAMEGISKSTEKINTIIHTIDEIAFQTNLLALNAAVEAARAGAVGKGFSVVAGEVRNLAQKAAGAAKDTADLIVSTVDQVKSGVHIVDDLKKRFEVIETSSTEAVRVINMITQSSSEQAQGIEQINIAISQMDKVTQENSSNAEMAASASIKLAEQSEQLMAIVTVLTNIVNGDTVKKVGNGSAGMHKIKRIGMSNTGKDDDIEL